MKLTKVQRLMLYSLGQFYLSLNQPLVEKPVLVRTSKIAFIELLLKSQLLTKHERAIYKNLESLEQKKMIDYDHKMITFTENGLKEVQKVAKEIDQFNNLQHYFETAEKPKRKLQTVIRY